jgi:hypothetical protein
LILWETSKNSHVEFGEKGPLSINAQKAIKHPFLWLFFNSKFPIFFQFKCLYLQGIFLLKIKNGQMKNPFLYCLFFSLIILNHINCQSTKTVKTSDKIKGMTLVAPHAPFKNAAMQEIQVTKSQWIAVVPYGFTRMGTPTLRYEGNGWQDWGESYEGVKVSIDSAHKAGLKVMLKPQVWVGGGWIGGLDFGTNEDWEKWEKDYEKYILPFAKIADSTGVELLCIGTEIKQSATKRPQFWRNLIAKTRAVYLGKLVYAANWDEYNLVSFWNELDYIGIDAYFSLVPKADPSVSELVAAWKPHLTAIQTYQKQQNKPVLFTEFGYMPIDSCTYKSWEIEKRRRGMPINESAQAKAIDALFTAFWAETWWKGGFLWKWFPEVKATDGRELKDYTPQGKQAIGVLQKWYGEK